MSKVQPVDFKIGLRVAGVEDAEAIAAIYAPIVRDTAISFETEPPSASAMAERIEMTQQRYPWLVAVTDQNVLGYAYASEHRQRAAYRWSVDVTAYVAESARGQGVGRLLYNRLILMLRTQGFRSAFAGIALPNEASIGLHEAVGFEALGVTRMSVISLVLGGMWAGGALRSPAMEVLRVSRSPSQCFERPRFNSPVIIQRRLS